MKLLCFLVVCVNFTLAALSLGVRRQADDTERLADVAAAQLCEDHPTHTLCGGTP